MSQRKDSPEAKNWRRNMDEGRPLGFDMDPGVIPAVQRLFDPHKLAQELVDQTANVDLVKSRGQRAMTAVIKVADSKDFEDHTGYMLREVFKQTGISFPHRLQRYLELFLLSLRPGDRWTVVESTRRRIRIQQESCSLKDSLKSEGRLPEGNICRHFCLAAIETAADKTGDVIEAAIEGGHDHEKCMICISSGRE